MKNNEMILYQILLLIVTIGIYALLVVANYHLKEIIELLRTVR
jgi:hypothetical protein